MNPLGKPGVRPLTASTPAGRTGHAASGEEAAFNAGFNHFALHPARTPRLAGARLRALTVPDAGHDDEGMEELAAAESAALPQAYGVQQATVAIRSAVSRAAGDIRLVLQQLKSPQR